MAPWGVLGVASRVQSSIVKSWGNHWFLFVFQGFGPLGVGLGALGESSGAPQVVPGGPRRVLRGPRVRLTRVHSGSLGLTGAHSGSLGVTQGKLG